MKIGVVLPLGEDKEAGGAPSYDMIRDQAVRAEREGFE